nr:MAG TPA: tail completion protein [Caudoviricetes sp.]
MEFIDFIKALSKKIYDFTDKEVGIDNINALARPCYYIQVIDYKNEFFANYKKRIFISVDIMYIPENDENNTMEVYKALDELDNMFEIKGNKILKVKDRCLTLKNEHTKMVDGLGHYIFDLDLFDVYGTDLRTFDNSIETIKEILNDDTELTEYELLKKLDLFDENGNRASLFDENNDLISDEVFKKLSLFDKNGVPFNYKIMRNLKMKLKK